MWRFFRSCVCCLLEPSRANEEEISHFYEAFYEDRDEYIPPSYSKLNQECLLHQKFVDFNGYTAFFNHLNKCIEVELKIIEGEQCQRGRQITVGWKLQVSIDDSDNENQNSNLERGWNIVMGHLVRNRTGLFKVIPKGMHMQGLERGKQITIYLWRDHKTAEEWSTILQQIEEELACAQIRPSYRPPSSNAVINGSHYFSLRNDDNGNGNYQAPTEAIDPELDNSPYVGIIIYVSRNYPNFQEWAQHVEQPRESKICTLL